jgi:hypothetical protein
VLSTSYDPPHGCAPRLLPTDEYAGQRADQASRRSESVERFPNG